MSVTETERPEVFWVDATSKHVVDAMNGKDVEARFRDRADGTWTCGSHILTGWVRTHVFPWKSSERNGPIAQWKFCQVYEPQSWWLERPDPGPGCRLLGKFPDEPKLGTDEAWDCHSKEWRRTFANDGDQVKTVWYRRRIEPVEPEPKYKVDDRVRIIGPVPGCTLVGRIVRVKSKRLSVLDDGSSAWFYTVNM